MSLRPLFVTQVYEASLAAVPGFDDFNLELAEACRMAGVEVPSVLTGDPQERFREEVELAARGWSW